MLLGERAQARNYYEQALEVSGRLRFRPGGRVTPSPGRATAGGSRRGAEAEALEHLDYAITESP